VPAWRDLHADLQVRGLTTGVSTGPFDEQPGWTSEPTTEPEQSWVYRMMNVVTVVMGGAMRREFSGITAFNVPTIVLSSTRPAAQ